MAMYDWESENVQAMLSSIHFLSPLHTIQAYKLECEYSLLHDAFSCLEID